MNDWHPPELQRLTTQSSCEADDRVRHRLQGDLVYQDRPPAAVANQVHQLASARGLTNYEFGPKSIDDLRNEQLRLQKWGAKFAGANQLLKNEVESLKAELQKAYSTDPLRSGLHVTKEAYDLLINDYEAVKRELEKLRNERGLAADHLQRLRLARDEADEQRNESVHAAASAVDTVAALKSQLTDAQRITMQKQGAVQDLSHRLGELQSRYDVLAHHVLQLGEEKVSLLEALRERQSQLDFCIAQLQLLERDAKESSIWKQKYEDLLASTEQMKKDWDAERKKLMDEIDRLSKLLKECGEARSSLEARLNGVGDIKRLLPDTKGLDRSNSRFPKVIANTTERFGKTVLKGPTRMKEDAGVLKEKARQETTEHMNDSKALEKLPEKLEKEKMRHRGLVIRVRWHPTTGKHTFGTRHLLIDSVQGILGWAKAADGNVSKTINFRDIKRIAYGYASNMTYYKGRSDCPAGTRTPSSGSGNEDQLTPSPIGAPIGVLASWPKISLTSCFTIVTKDDRAYDFFTATDSEAFDWQMRLSRVLKDEGVTGLHTRVSFLAARGWTRLIETCCDRQITTRKLLIEGLEKAGVFAATTGLGTGKGTRKTRSTATRNPTGSAKVFKGGAGLGYKGMSSSATPSSDKSWMKSKLISKKDAKEDNPRENKPSDSKDSTSDASKSSEPVKKPSSTAGAKISDMRKDVDAKVKAKEASVTNKVDTIRVAAKVKAKTAPS